MANTKNSAKTTTKKVEKKEKVTEEIKNKENEEVLALKQQLEEMKKAMQELMKNNTQPSAPITQTLIVRDEKDEVTIGCRVLQGVGWSDPTGNAGEIRLSFNEEQTITVADMKTFFRQSNVKRLFEDGLCYFTESGNYTLFNVRKYIDLSDENLIKILTQQNTNDVIRGLNELTDNKKNSSVVNCIVFRICDMIRKNVLTWDYYTRKAIEEYFKMEFDRGIMILKALDTYKGR